MWGGDAVGQDSVVVAGWCGNDAVAQYGAVRQWDGTVWFWGDGVGMMWWRSVGR